MRYDTAVIYVDPFALIPEGETVSELPSIPSPLALCEAALNAQIEGVEHAKVYLYFSEYRRQGYDEKADCP